MFFNPHNYLNSTRFLMRPFTSEKNLFNTNTHLETHAINNVVIKNLISGALFIECTRISFLKVRSQNLKNFERWLYQRPRRSE